MARDRVRAGGHRRRNPGNHLVPLARLPRPRHHRPRVVAVPFLPRVVPLGLVHPPPDPRLSRRPSRRLPRPPAVPRLPSATPRR